MLSEENSLLGTLSRHIILAYERGAFGSAELGSQQPNVRRGLERVEERITLTLAAMDLHGRFGPCSSIVGCALPTRTLEGIRAKNALNVIDHIGLSEAFVL